MQSQRSFADFFTTPTKGCKLRVNEFNVFKNPQGKYAALVKRQLEDKGLSCDLPSDAAPP